VTLAGRGRLQLSGSIIHSGGVFESTIELVARRLFLGAMMRILIFQEANFTGINRNK
jgi:hypothetical protein